MNSKPKTPLLFLLFLIGAITATLFYYKNSKSISIAEGLANEPVERLRQQHYNHLASSPFKETLQLNKNDRKAQGLPPNKYFEQMWELTINPVTGRTEPEKISKLQQTLKKAFLKRAPGDDLNNPWIERGPNNIGGRTRALIFDPNDASN